MSSSLFQLKNQHALTVDKCKEQIELAKNENKIFLRQALQSRLVNLLNLEKNFSQAVLFASQLVRELKKVDDKELLVDVLLEESIAFYHLSNLTKARASLTNARTIANSKYTPPAMQAKLDLQSGILHAADDHDFKTAFSYFYEAFEAFDSVNDSNMAQKALKYMLLSKIMTDNSDEVASILSGKTVSKYSGPEIDAMRALANAAKQRSLKEFNETFAKYGSQLMEDPVVQKHFSSISDTMFEKELSRLIQPYSCVQIDHIAKSVGLDRERVERKLSQMILDKKFYGCLQGDGILVIYEKETVDPSFELAIESIHAIGEVVDALGERAKKVK
ncbi:PCI domain-containing protein [Meloidogyne graminicola]|uniref:PCI domain-containing protein n=1 Tax=Meloidogyne graminicola TaxID=189291 RepID=A0A8S9ZYV4_9BILA|nr:PCI domain-containing protein [Meloidogyne graminicola]